MAISETLITKMNDKTATKDEVIAEYGNLTTDADRTELIARFLGLL